MTLAPDETRREDGLVLPHGGRLVDRTADRPEGIDRLPVISLSTREAADLDMVASGALSPLRGFMSHSDYERVLADLRLADGLPWALPVCLAVRRPPRTNQVALSDRRGRSIAVLDVEDAYRYSREVEAERCFETTDPSHPGVARVLRQGEWYVAGKVTVFERPAAPFPALALDPAETRAAFRERRWKRVVGFQTRNPLHRAHEYLTKGALEGLDGLLLHPLVGETKADDVPVETRVECYRVLLQNYYPRDRVVLAAFPAAMRYAGPREAIWHAICRKNYGCSHFIVGRDHAGVGDYYGPYDAHTAFDAFAPEELGIEPLLFDHAFYCRACDQMATDKTCPHAEEARVILSGTRVRQMIRRGDMPPAEFSRPEVAQLLVAALGRRPLSAAGAF
ncbi:MAG: sulfate adenylyltransferase [Actinobacteria bacterium]|nr:sulfate adenylyltransferase [Actinomycetota bacterium]